ncbi:hypothetical protein [Gimesia aquarii]|uniref:Uncharacterized protein n=1 Tax=Gimesia aquarii TaxID=2527964 RepID=A0A517VP25_9PLAN|nr:hypothetical protein [Gimesia aquarii]QDT94762.1 hypothetical protein V144x_01930 [Gimesia aquarii]
MIIFAFINDDYGSVPGSTHMGTPGWRNKRTGATGFELLLVLTVLLAGLVFTMVCGERFGLLGYLAGFPAGCAIAFAVLYGLIALFALLEGVVKDGIPYLPPCRSGNCRSGLLADFGDIEPEQHEGEFGYFRCRCGELYERRRSKKRVLFVSANGDKVPYMKWQCCRGWCKERRDGKDDNSEAPPPQ